MIKINDKYYINSDSLNYTLLERKIINDIKSKNYGEERFECLGFYGTLETLKKSCLEKEIKDDLGILNNIDKVIELKKQLESVNK